MNLSKSQHQSELEKLKEEILSKIKHEEKPKKRLNWGSLAVTGILALLTIISITQAVQSANILGKINSGAIKPASAAGSSATPLPSNLQNLPNMVGGC